MSQRLSQSRLARVGGRDGLVIAQRTAFAALAAALAWLAVSALRPLPGDIQVVGDAPRTLTPPEGTGRDLAERERLVAGLGARGNIFAPDGKTWPVVIAATREAKTVEIGPAEAGQGAADPSPSQVDMGSALAEIALSASAPSAVRRELEALSLRALYGLDGEMAAIIRDASIQEARLQARAYRVGEKIGQAEWDLVAIDPLLNRVIVRRLGHTLEVRMYEQIAAHSEGAPASAFASGAPIPNALGVVEMTREEIAGALAEAELTPEEIEELLALVDTVEMPADAREPVAMTAESKSDAGGAGTAPLRQMPAEMVDLLRMMATDAQRTRNAERAKSKEGPTPPRPTEGGGSSGG